MFLLERFHYQDQQMPSIRYKESESIWRKTSVLIWTHLQIRHH